MGFWGSVGSFIGGAVSAIGGAISSIGGALASAASTFLKVAGEFLGPVAQIISAISNMLGIKKEEEDLEEIGAKAMQSDKKPEDFDNYTDYINHLRNDIQLDKAKFEKAGDAEKLARTAVGATVLAKGIEDKKGFEIPNETWVAMAKLGLENKEKEVDALLDTFKNGKLEDFARYVDGKLDAKTEGEVGDKLVQMYQKLEPSASIEDIEKKVMNMDKS